MAKALLTMAIRQEQDVVIARQRAREIARIVGFEGQDQTRIATAVSEIVRNAFRYAKGGKVESDMPVGPRAETDEHGKHHHACNQLSVLHWPPTPRPIATAVPPAAILAA